MPRTPQETARARAAQRLMHVLRFLDLPQTEIAARLGISQSQLSLMLGQRRTLSDTYLMKLHGVVLHAFTEALATHGIPASAAQRPAALLTGDQRTWAEALNTHLASAVEAVQQWLETVEAEGNVLVQQRQSRMQTLQALEKKRILSPAEQAELRQICSTLPRILDDTAMVAQTLRDGSVILEQLQEYMTALTLR